VSVGRTRDKDVVAVRRATSPSGSSGWSLGRRGARSANRAPALLPVKELAPRDICAWRELATRAVEPNPFFEPECVLPAARHLGEPDVRLLVVTGSDREWLACMPVMPRVRRWHARLPVFTAWRNLYGCLGTPLVAGSAVEIATERLAEQALRASSFGVVALPWLGQDGPVACALRETLAASARELALHRSFERAVVRRATLVDDLDAVISARHRRNLSRLSRRLAEALEAPLMVRDESESAGAAEDFMALEASGWKGEAGTAFRATPAHAAYFTELCAGFRAAGRLQLLALGTADRSVSYKCNLLAGDAVFCFKIAHDESFARYRPGIQLELEMLKRFRDGMSETWMDSCAAPDSKLFEHFWPERRPLGSYVLTANAVIGRAINHNSARLASRARS
jgi:CelD/BcsL family acetyltransferase involved in cellulose biosynthesis